MSDVPIEVIRSAKRKRTVQASYVGGRLLVRVPAGLDPGTEADLVEQAREKVLRRLSSKGVDLDRRARALADRYGLRRPVAVEWSSRQMQRWGSCTPDQGLIRISDRLASMPGWVLDSVLVHELAHLEIADHGPGFQALANRYQLAERAKGYLIAKGEGRPV